MPTYEYVCKSCGHLFEIVQSMRDDPLTECPECAGELRKVFAPPAIAFKGSGFYATDHGKKAKPSGGEGTADQSAGKAGEKAGGKAGEQSGAPSKKKEGAGTSGSKNASPPSSSKASSSSKDGGS